MRKLLTLPLLAMLVTSITALVVPAPKAEAAFPCGNDGPRTEFVYVRPLGEPDRLAQANAHAAAIRADINNRISFGSATYREVRWVCNGPISKVVNLTVGNSSGFDISSMVQTLTNHGLDRADRKYIVLWGGPHPSLCGQASVYQTSYQPQSTNPNNYLGHATAYTNCWDSAWIGSHEYAHVLGAVLANNPHNNGTLHPNDSNRDILNCGVDSYWCEWDYGKNTYFNINPAPGSYLANNWNTANSAFLYPNAAPPRDNPTPIRGGPSVNPRIEAGGNWVTDIVVRGANNGLYHRKMEEWYGYSYSPWQYLGGPPNVALTSDPDSTSWGGDRIDILIRGSDGNVWRLSREPNNVWHWYNEGAPPAGVQGGPGVTTIGYNQLSIYVRGNDNTMWFKEHVPGVGWTAWQLVGQGWLSSSDIDATTSPGPYKEITFIGTNSYMYRAYSINGGPYTLEQHGCCYQTGATGINNGWQWDLMARGFDSHIYRKRYVNYAWGGTGSSGCCLASAPDGARESGQRGSVFATGFDGQIYRNSWNDQIFTGWQIVPAT